MHCSSASAALLSRRCDLVLLVGRDVYAVQVFADWATLYGTIYKFNLAGADLIVLTDPQEFAKLASREVNLPKAGQMYRILNVVWRLVTHAEHLHLFRQRSARSDQL